MCSMIRSSKPSLCSNYLWTLLPWWIHPLQRQSETLPGFFFFPTVLFKGKVQLFPTSRFKTALPFWTRPLDLSLTCAECSSVSRPFRGWTQTFHAVDSGPVEMTFYKTINNVVSNIDLHNPKDIVTLWMSLSSLWPMEKAHCCYCERKLWLLGAVA